MPTIVQSCRIEESDAALLSRQAKRRHLEVSTLSSLYLKEKALEEEFPGIGFRDAAGGRESLFHPHCQLASQGWRLRLPIVLNDYNTEERC